MKTIGMIGGMSWESSAEYYRIINKEVKKRLGDLHSAKCVLASVDFAEIEVLQREGRWEEAGRAMAEQARVLERAGADFVVLCTNTMHISAAEIEAAISIPFLHIADPTAGAVKAAGIQSVGLLGTRFTMEQDFYKGRLQEKHGLRVLVPDAEDRDVVHRVIYEELVLGVVNPQSRAQYARIMQALVDEGAQGIILGCTEIGLLVKAEDSRVPLFDTTLMHALAAVDLALK
ncbi:MAG: aspartate/glutamate racemase family protein [Anaerolineae bacterium]|jgi:aspartate racemase|nr:aspartate/glutamate racemase family protein [Anaerolineae bacterium]